VMSLLWSRQTQMHYWLWRRKKFKQYSMGWQQLRFFLNCRSSWAKELCKNKSLIPRTLNFRAYINHDERASPVLY
jgi:hypothetical protein